MKRILLLILLLSLVATVSAIPDANVMTLLHFNGTNESATITDETGRTWWNEGPLQILTLQSKFGGASLYLPGTANYLLSANNTDDIQWKLGVNRTMDLWINATSVTTTNQYIIGNRMTNSYSAGWVLWLAYTGSGKISFVVWNSAAALQIDSGSVLSAKKWHHIAVVETSDNVVKLYVDGVYNGTTTLTGTISQKANVSIGDRPVGSTTTTGRFAGYIDELRFVNETVWFDNFTVESAEYGYPTGSSEFPLDANFTQSPNPSVVGQSVAFGDTTNGTVTTRNWTFFYDGGSFNDRNTTPNYTWSSAGTFNVFLNVTNSSGGMSNISKTQTVVNASELYPQDLWMEGAYEQTFIITDASSGLFLNNVTITDSGGDTATTGSNGTAWLTEPFGSDIITFTANGYNQRQIAYVFDENATHSVALTASTTPLTGVELAGTPKDVKFHIQSFFGTPITTANVSIQGITTTLGNWAWLAQLLSLDLDEAPINSTQMFGPTDSNGDVVFLMVDTIRYNISVTAPGYTFPITYISPQTSTYTISANMNETWFASGNDTIGEVNVSVSWVTINTTHSFVNVTYNDATQKTTSGTISVYLEPANRRANLTPMANLTITSYNCTNSTIVATPTGGASYRVFVNGTTPDGQITRSFTHYFKGAPVALPGWTSETLLWLALFIVIFTAAFAGATHSPQMAIILCVESWVFWAIGWLDYLISGSGYAEAAILGVLTLASFITVWWNVTEGKAKGKRSS